MLPILAAAAVAAAPVAETPQQVEGLEITTRRPMVGTLEQGVQAYRPEFFTPVRPSNAMDMIRWLPSFTFEDVRDLRGLGGVTGNVFIDGKPPTSKTDTLSTILARLPADQVERVDIVVGGAPGIDMRGHDVVANIVMKKTDRTKGVIQAQSLFVRDGRIGPELLVTAARNANGRTFDSSLTVGQRILPGTGWGDGEWVRRDGAGGVIFRDPDEHNRVGGPQIIGTGSYEFPWAKGKLRINGSGRWMKAQLDDQAHPPGLGLYSLKVTDLYRQGELGLRYERLFGKRTTLETQVLQRVTGHDSDVATRRPPVISDFDEGDRQHESVVRGVLRWKRDETLTIEGSAEGAFNGLITHASLLTAGAPTVVPAANVRIHEDRGEFGTLLTWKLSKAVGLTAQLRVETSQLTAVGDVSLTRTLTYAKPRVVASWAIDKNTQLRLRAEREVGQINFFNFVANSEFNSGQVRAGNPDLRPQRNWTGEATLERQFWTGASIVLTYRRRALTDVVDAKPIGTSGAFGQGNIGDGTQTDLVATLTLPLKRLGLDGAMLKGTVTSVHGRVTDPTTGLKRPLINNVPLAELHFAYDLPRLKLNWGVDTLTSNGVILFRPAGREVNHGFTRINLYAEYRYRPNLTFRVEAANITGVKPLQRIEYYTGLRGSSPLLYTDDRRLGLGPYVTLRARRTF